MIIYKQGIFKTFLYKFLSLNKMTAVSDSITAVISDASLTIEISVNDSIAPIITDAVNTSGYSMSTSESLAPIFTDTASTGTQYFSSDLVAITLADTTATNNSYTTGDMIYQQLEDINISCENNFSSSDTTTTSILDESSVANAIVTEDSLTMTLPDITLLRDINITDIFETAIEDNIANSDKEILENLTINFDDNSITEGILQITDDLISQLTAQPLITLPSEDDLHLFIRPEDSITDQYIPVNDEIASQMDSTTLTNAALKLADLLLLDFTDGININSAKEVYDYAEYTIEDGMAECADKTLQDELTLANTIDNMDNINGDNQTSDLIGVNTEDLAIISVAVEDNLLASFSEGNESTGTQETEDYCKAQIYDEDGIVGVETADNLPVSESEEIYVSTSIINNDDLNGVLTENAINEVEVEDLLKNNNFNDSSLPYSENYVNETILIDIPDLAVINLNMQEDIPLTIAESIASTGDSKLNDELESYLYEISAENALYNEEDLIPIGFEDTIEAGNTISTIDDISTGTADIIKDAIGSFDLTDSAQLYLAENEQSESGAYEKDDIYLDIIIDPEIQALFEDYDELYLENIEKIKNFIVYFDNYDIIGIGLEDFCSNTNQITGNELFELLINDTLTEQKVDSTANEDINIRLDADVIENKSTNTASDILPLDILDAAAIIFNVNDELQIITTDAFFNTKDFKIKAYTYHDERIILLYAIEPQSKVNYISNNVISLEQYKTSIKSETIDSKSYASEV
jgi:hypothetical protein